MAIPISHVLSAVLLLLAPIAAAQHVHGGTDDSPGVTMVPYLHFTPGDALWFVEWVPRSKGAILGACIGLFVLAIVERWVAACRAMMELHWRHGARIAQSKKRTDTANAEKLTFAGIALMRTAPPFIPMYDIARGLMHMVQTALGFLFMLAVMTYQVSFIIAVVLGMGVGEVMFGRYIHHLG